MKCIAITGHYATGSGAVYNLLQEYESITDGRLTRFEHMFLYDVNGVFETIDRILNNNSLFNSNAAINAFREEMNRLNQTNFGWFGGYRYRYGDRFQEIIEEFITDIVEYRIDKSWYGIYDRRKYTVKKIVKDTAKLILRKKTFHDGTFGTRISMKTDNLGEFSFATEEKLQAACKKLIENYLNMLFPNESKIAILNHMVSPQDLSKMPGYYPNDFKIIIVERDIRDIYAYNKYIWKSVWGDDHTFPTEPEEFIRFMRGYRSTINKYDSDHILQVQFEDLIYKYDETVHMIEQFAGVQSKDHIRKKQVFVPEKSIKNTQVFRMKEEWSNEMKLIAEAFPELVYNFPYELQTNTDAIFDA